jgi:hypothetical protein
MSDLHEHKHDDFEVVRTDNRFGGFEELRHKDHNARVSSHSLQDSLYLLLIVETPYRTHASSANTLPRITPMNWMTCTSFHYYARSLYPSHLNYQD